MNAHGRFKELEREARDCEGWRIRSDLFGLARSHCVFLGNDRELTSFLEAHEQGPLVLEFWDVQNQDVFERFLDEVDRLFHNYLASVWSVRDRTLGIRNKYAAGNEGFAEEYARMEQEIFVNAPVCAFVQKLRHYSVHWRLPIARAKHSGARGSDFQSAVNLIKSDLLVWKGWKTAKMYLSSAADEIPLKGVVCEYTTAVKTFNTWFEEAFVRTHASAFDQLKALEAAAAAVFRQAAGETTEPLRVPPNPLVKVREIA